jgi:AbrB family looped-hinge helix DNA binding protein
MEITIDKTGRLVLPKPIRDRFNLVEGTQLEVELEADGVRLRVPTGDASLRRKQGILVHHGSSVVQLDVAEFMRGEREARALQMSAKPAITP